MNEGIYLDHHTVAQPSSSAIDAMIPFYREFWGSPLSFHQKGQELFSSINQAMSRVYDVLGADAHDELLLTSSGAEAIAAVFSSTFMDFCRETGRTHFLAPATEDTAITQSMKRLQTMDCASKWLPVDNCGRLRAEVLEEALKPRAALLSLSWASGLTGVIQPMADLTRICQSKEVRIHVDASYVIGKLFFRFADEGIDYLTFEGSSFHAPRGVGGVLSKRFNPLRSWFSGTPDIHVAPLVALSVALEEAQQNFDALCTETARLRDKFEHGIRTMVDDAHLFFQEADRLPNTSVIAFPGIAAETMLYALNRRGVYATMGGGKLQKLEHILKICGYMPSLAASALSFSLSYKTTEEEIDRAVTLIADAARDLHVLSGGL